MDYTRIQKINTLFLQKAEAIKCLSKCLNDVKRILSESSSSDNMMRRVVSELNNLGNLINDDQYKNLKEIRYVGNRYIDTVKNIRVYRDGLLNGGDAVYASINSLVQAQELFTNGVRSINSTYGCQIDDLDSYNTVVVQILNRTISDDNQYLEQLKGEALTYLRGDVLELRSQDSLPTVNSLPVNMKVGNKPAKQAPLQVLKAAGVKSMYEEVDLDLYHQGNAIVNVGFKEMSDKEIDYFVTAYVFRYLESFPLGAAHVHIIDDNTNYLYKRLYNNFQNESNGESVKDIIHIHTSVKSLSEFRDVICEDIFLKTSVNTPDLYSIHEKDKTDAFNLIILRDGLVDASGYVSAEVLDMINSLTKPGAVGHKCGLRFLIIDSSKSFENTQNDSNKHLISLIHDNCELNLSYSQGRFMLGEDEIEMIHIVDDVDSFIQDRSGQIIDTINKKEKNIVSIDDISSDKVGDEPSTIMYIPIGMSGGKVVELPFSCKDEDGTVAGQCVGYMAIGQSGSGKSSFFHSLVLNGCTKYSPCDLQFWLLDFKNGGASSKYSKSGIPHIKIIAENNKIDDALCLFQMVLEEMERRNKLFNKNFTDNIIEYNAKAKACGMEYLPRIIIAIDEVQEIFREDNASEIQKLISSISTRMRSSGMHFVMVAQNLSEGKTYMLKEAFLPSATGRICFRVAQDIPRDSGFGEEYIDRRQEISGLKTGEAYVSYGSNTIKKVKMAFASTQEMSSKFFKDICDKYPDYRDMRPLVIGSKKRLVISDQIQGQSYTYYDLMRNINSNQVGCHAFVGEDVYRMEPLDVVFSSNENSSILLLGSDKSIASSFCASIVLSLLRQNVKVHLFNGDRTKVAFDNEVVQHPYMHVCQELGNKNENIVNHRLDQLPDVLKTFYSDYLERQSTVQRAEYEDPTFAPLFLVINDLFGIESFVANVAIESDNKTPNDTETKNGFGFNYDIFTDRSSVSTDGSFKETIQNILNILIKNGYRYNIFIVLSLRGDPATWRGFRLSSEFNNVFMFNDTEYSDQIDNSYFMREMLKNISNYGEQETLAVCSTKKRFSKIRPIIYNLSNSTELEAIDLLIEGGGT